MLDKIVCFVKNFIRIYTDTQVTIASAALSYYFTMTFFPLIICLYTMLGNSYDQAMRIVQFLKSFASEEAIDLISDFLVYVASNNSPAMMVAGLAVLVTSASAASRSIQTTIGRMQGGVKFKAFMYFAFSILFSLVFLAAIYFAMLVMLTGRQFITTVNKLLPFIDISHSWNWMRFLVMGGIFFVLVWGVYETAKRNCDEYSTFPGTVVTTVALVAESLLFSVFIGRSAKYPLVYGSLASLILLMLWLYSCCLIIYVGAAVNIALRDTRQQTESTLPAEKCE
ncbi:MAG: YihY/virulence factor BrkB family protein [Eubacteriales bacterium]|nr:YihY/virulence factor BrkB family protein [Eubacteriales bacterium]